MIGCELLTSCPCGASPCAGLESLTLRPRRFAELSALPEALASLGGSLRELSLRAFNQTGWVPVLYHAHFVFDADDPNDPGEGGVDEVRPENPLEALCALTQLEVRGSASRGLAAGGCHGCSSACGRDLTS